MHIREEPEGFLFFNTEYRNPMFPHLLIYFTYPLLQRKGSRSYDKNPLLELEAYEHKIMHDHGKQCIIDLMARARLKQRCSGKTQAHQ